MERMEYFELSQSELVENAVEIVGLDKEKYPYRMSGEDFEALDRLKVAYFSGREFEELCEVLVYPTFLVSDRLKRLLELHEKQCRFKGLQLFPTAQESGQYPLYWVPCFPELDCLHPDTVVLDNGFVDRLVLDGRKLADRPVFRIPGLVEYRVVVSLPVAEGILRRRCYGVGLRRLEVV